METCKVTVIVAVYNAARYLERCVNSICLQTYKNLEIILVNDGSTDNSGEICDDFAKNDKRVLVIHQSNKGDGCEEDEEQLSVLFCRLTKLGLPYESIFPRLRKSHFS